MCHILRSEAPDSIGCDAGVVFIIPLIRGRVHDTACLSVVMDAKPREGGSRTRPSEVQRMNEERELLKQLSCYYELSMRHISIRANRLLSRGEHGSTVQYTRNVPLT